MRLQSVLRRRLTRRGLALGPALVGIVILAASGCGGSTGGFGWRDDDAAWSPNGRAIAFVSNRAHPANPEANTNQLYVIKPDGSSLRRLTNSGGAEYPRFSPGGRRIAYIDDSTNLPRLELIDASGGGRRTLTSTWIVDSTIPPAWSPDGRWIAFATDLSNDVASPMDLWLIAPDGSRLTRVAKRIDTSSYSPLFSWSPDSRRLAFGCRNGGVCVVSLLGGAVHTVTAGRSDVEGTTSVQWSSDGKQIAFLRNSPSSDYEALNQHSWVIDANGRDEHELPRFGEGSVDQLVWLPKNLGMLAAAGDNSGHIYLVRSNGASKRDLRLGGWDDEPVPSPDGTKVVFDRIGAAQDNGAPQFAALFVATLPKGGVRQLTQTPG